jgi:regulator of replication initiation timing
MPGLRAQNPAARQDAEAAREKLLKAADELDNIQANSETTKTAVDGMKNDVGALQQTVTKLQGDNAALRQQLVELQTAFDQYKDEQVKARQKLIDDVAGLIAASKGSTKPEKKKSADANAETPVAAKKTDTPPSAASLAPPPDKSPATATVSTPTTDNTPPPPKPQKGYYYVVAPGQTLTMIVAAYKEKGVNVTVAEVRKANGLSENSGVKAGQKIFIPKPGT